MKGITKLTCLLNKSCDVHAVPVGGGFVRPGFNVFELLGTQVVEVDVMPIVDAVASQVELAAIAIRGRLREVPRLQFLLLLWQVEKLPGQLVRFAHQLLRYPVVHNLQTFLDLVIS